MFIQVCTTSSLPVFITVYLKRNWVRGTYEYQYLVEMCILSFEFDYLPDNRFVSLEKNGKLLQNRFLQRKLSRMCSIPMHPVPTSTASECMNNHIYSTLYKRSERKSDRRSKETEQRKNHKTHTHTHKKTTTTEHVTSQSTALILNYLAASVA